MSRARDFANLGATASSGGISGKNIVDNGEFAVDQRNSGSAVTPANATPTFGPDRWYMYKDTAATFTIDQDTTAPDGFNFSLKVTNTGVDSSISATDRALIVHRIEGDKIRYLKLGSSDAKKVTLSFYVRSSLTGTHGGAFRNHDSNQRNYPFTYTISAVDTWERKSISLTLDTSGTWPSDNTLGLQVQFGLGVGTTFSGTAGAWADGDINSATGAVTTMLSTASATWYVTGVQLEVGETATAFEHKSYADDYNACLRYFWRYSKNTSYGEFLLIRTYSTSAGTGAARFPMPMRSDPTLAVNVTVNSSNFGYSLSSLAIGASDINHTSFEYNCAGSFTANGAAIIQKVDNTDLVALDFDAELD